MLKFHGKVALITGSGTGIGRAIAERFVENGAGVIILGRRKEPLAEAAAALEKVAEQKQSGAAVRIFDGVDVSDEAGVNGMFDALEADGVMVDYIINNAGVSGPVRCFASAPLDEFASTVGIHLTGTFWTSARGLRVMKKGGKIVTISTFFTEERPLEQRPYRFRSPYTASQGAKNRLAEAMSWELVDRGITSIATNPGPVHSDRIYKTVYPKAAAEFMRVGGFGDLAPREVDAANGEIVPLLGEDESAVRDGIARAAQKIGGDRDLQKLEATLAGLLEKIQGIAEKIQGNTSHMIANREFLSQSQVAESVLNLCDDGTASILNGKVIPGDRVFYPVRAHVGNAVPGVHQVDFSGRSVVITADGADAARVEHLAAYVQGNGGKVACLASTDAPREIRDAIAGKVHTHDVDLSNPDEVARWLETADSKLGRIMAVVHMTGDVPEMPRLVDLPRDGWDKLVQRFVVTPAVVARQAMERFVPGGGADPRKFEGAAGAVMIVGPALPVGKKVPGARRAQIEVFRGALRPFAATVNQELSEVLKSDVRVFAVLPGSVTGAQPNPDRVADALNFMVSSSAAASPEVVFCVDESR